MSPLFSASLVIGILQILLTVGCYGIRVTRPQVAPFQSDLLVFGLPLLFAVVAHVFSYLRLHPSAAGQAIFLSALIRSIALTVLAEIFGLYIAFNRWGT